MSIVYRFYCTLKEIGLEPQQRHAKRHRHGDCTLKEIGLEPQRCHASRRNCADCTLKEIGLEPQPLLSD